MYESTNVSFDECPSIPNEETEFVPVLVQSQVLSSLYFRTYGDGFC